MWFSFSVSALVLCFAVFGKLAESQNSSDVTERQECLYAPGLLFLNNTRRAECCSVVETNFDIYWANGDQSLTLYFETLKAWQCRQFQEECERRTFTFTPYTRLVYDLYCDYDSLVRQCFDIVNTTVQPTIRNLVGVNNTDTRTDLSIQQPNEPSEGSTDTSLVLNIGTNSTLDSDLLQEWRYLLENIDESLLTTAQILQPCMQVVLYESEGVHRGDFQEIIHSDIPSCGITWCGVQGNSVVTRTISTWLCLSSGCRAGIIIIIVICAFLAFFVTFVNLSVILAISLNPKLRHSQSVYKFSLAIADVITGIIVLPTFISTLLRLSQTKRQLPRLVDVTGFPLIDGEVSNISTTVQVREAMGPFTTQFPDSYLDGVGFFTTLSLMVSVYTLAIAGFDRLSAVYRPLKYRKDKAKLLAKYLSGGLWIFSIIFAIFPVFLPGLRYALVSSFLISLGGRNALILYAIMFILPLITMWVLSILTYLSTRKHARARKHLNSDSKDKTKSIEYRLARTLGIMSGVFTLSLLPAVIVVVASLFIPTIYFDIPRQLEVEGAAAYVSAEFAAALILVLNSFWNFFIYNARNQEFKTAVNAMYGTFGDRTGINACWRSTKGYAVRVAHDGRRRFSAIPTITSQTGRRKSSGQTTLTQLGTKVTGDSSNDSASRTNGSTVVAGERRASSGYSETNLSTDTGLNTSTSRSSIKKPKRNPKNIDKSVTNDSVFDSFAIDANADRLFMSVMENIPEEVIELDENGKVVVENKTKK